MQLDRILDLGSVFGKAGLDPGQQCCLVGELHALLDRGDFLVERLDLFLDHAAVSLDRGLVALVAEPQDLAADVGHVDVRLLHCGDSQQVVAVDALGHRGD